MEAARYRFHSNLQSCRCCNKISLFFLQSASLLPPFGSAAAENQRLRPHSSQLQTDNRPWLIPSPPADDSDLGCFGTLRRRLDRQRGQLGISPPHAAPQGELHVLQVKQVPAGRRWAATKVSLTFPPPRRLPILAACCKPVDIYQLIWRNLRDAVL